MKDNSFTKLLVFAIPHHESVIGKHMSPPSWTSRKMVLMNLFAGQQQRHGSDGKVSIYNAGDPGSITGLGRSPGEGNGNPFQYSCLENPMERGAWQATVHRIARVRHDLATKPPPSHPPTHKEMLYFYFIYQTLTEGLLCSRPLLNIKSFKHELFSSHHKLIR